MFREMRRKKQQLTDAQCIEILKNEPRGVLSVLGDDGYPYGMPMDHWYCPEDGCLYFHCSRQGHRLDAIRGCDKASFCVMDQGFRREGEWAMNIRSVIVFGRIRAIEDPKETEPILRRLAAKYTADSAYIEDSIRRGGSHALILALTPEHITGKLVNES